MSDKTCNRCGRKGLNWDYDFKNRTGKWKLENHKVDGKWCNKPTEASMIRKKHEVVMCELCIDSNFGLCTPETIEDHHRKYHPNNKPLTNLDYMVMVGGIPKYLLHYWKDDPHYSMYENQKG